VPFHVEIRHSYRRAWAFNLSEERLRGTILEPWRRGGPVELGDRDWDPRESTISVLEGPELAPPDLAHGQGWHHAERSGEDVTGEVLSRTAAEAVRVSVLGESEGAQSAVLDLVRQLGVNTIDWSALRARILGAATAAPGAPLGPGEIPVVVLVLERSQPPPAWLFDAGLALGALGSRAIVVQLTDEPAPPSMRDLGVIRVDPGDGASQHAFAERLRRAAAGRP
jgi:hypothetical protein